ncbi:MAG: DUF4124 domain-containing protein [Telluria sp.]
MAAHKHPKIAFSRQFWPPDAASAAIDRPPVVWRNANSYRGKPFMRPALRFNLPRLIAPLLLVAAGLAHAQYSWIDEKGIRQLSDRPPPPGTPASRILKAPGKASAPAPEPAEGPARQADGARPREAARDQADPRPLAEREAGFLKKVRVMTAKSPNDDAKNEQARQRYCQQARRYKDWLGSGAPMDKKGENGEKRPLSKEERASELARAEAALASCP